MYSNIHYVPAQRSGLGRGGQRLGVWMHDVAHLSVTLSTDHPGGGQRGGQDLPVGSVRPGQVPPGVLHCYSRHWFHSEFTVPLP